MLPEKIEDVRQWLAHAQEDLRLAERLASAQEFPRASLFHSQQAAEKALKGFLVWHDRAFRATHDLRPLVRACAAVAPELTALEATAEELTPYAVASRYPGRLPEPTATQVTEAVRAAGQIFRQILDRLPPEVKA